jgi:hypothetical protein
MYETVHLFSRYGHPNRVQSTSSNDSLVSAYSSISNKGDSLTVIFVNRAEKDAQDINLDLANFATTDGAVKTLTLQNLQGETFVSHTSNALQAGTATATGNKVSLKLPAKSITAALLTSNSPIVVDGIRPKATIRPAPQYGTTRRFDTKGRNVTHTRTSPGYYILR